MTASSNFLIAALLLTLAVFLSHHHSHSSRVGDDLAFCPPLYSLHHLLSDTALSSPAYHAIDYVCGDF